MIENDSHSIHQVSEAASLICTQKVQLMYLAFSYSKHSTKVNFSTLNNLVSFAFLTLTSTGVLLFLTLPGFPARVSLQPCRNS
jgi:hypothetical protein